MKAQANFMAIGAGIVASCVITMSSAQQSDNALETDSTALEEIVITAKRRLEVMQDVVIAATAFTGKMLEEMKIDTVNALSQFSPGWIVTNLTRQHHSFICAVSV